MGGAPLIVRFLTMMTASALFPSRTIDAPRAGPAGSWSCLPSL